ncbi:ATP-binding cassette domain-containing protein [Actinopolymorpha sp. NPDC004070]|uniref:ATP-binding cassette domain-containing protein n=1 Tax=Actinopolymorpha sp. NPDC004070 TaxID=3154548 RepID=UPI0033A30353
MSAYAASGVLDDPAPLPSGRPAIEAAGLAKTYGSGDKAVRALAGITFSVPAGSVFGLLGPNGAGKSTTVKILTTLSRADAGSASVAGIDVHRHPARVRRAIGYVSQKPAFDPMGTGRENLVLAGRVHGLSGPSARSRADELLARFGLTESGNRLAGKWSGGMQRKLDVATGLVHRPSVLFMDEPTTGLDPQARAEMWAEIARLAREDGLTVLLTTHYLEEADRLADRLVIIDRGRVVAAGTPEELKAQLDGDTVQAEIAAADQAEVARSALTGVPGVHDVSVEETTVRARVSNGAATLPAVLTALDGARVGLTAVTVARPSLDDVYLRHAGRSFDRADTASLPRQETNR